MFTNFAAREISFKIVYYGAGLCGKTTNLRWMQQQPDYAGGKLHELATESERTLYFDFMPMDLGAIRGFKTRLNLYTVPGQVFYAASRKLVLQNADGVVFVADSQGARREANQESLENLFEHALENNLTLGAYAAAGMIPLVIQYNKRDSHDVMDLPQMRDDLFSDPNMQALLDRSNQHIPLQYEAVAKDGRGVRETLKGIGTMVMRGLKK